MFPETHYLQVVACKLLCRLHSSSGGSRGHSEAENRNDVLQQYVTAIQIIACFVCRTICEVAMVPESGSGMFGDVFNLLLMPQEDLEALTKQVRFIFYLIFAASICIRLFC